MRTAFTPASRARREATTALVRHRMDTLFGPQDPFFPVAQRVASAVPMPPPLPLPDPLPLPIPLPLPLPQEPIAAASRAAASGAAASLPAASPDPPPPRFRLSFALALKERWDLDRRAVLGLAVLLVLALGYGVQHFWAGRPEAVAVPAPAVEGTAAAGAGSPSAAASATAIAGLVVDVSGRVRSPGLRTLPPGSRVQDAVTAAGGALPGTDLTGLNLARKLNDGEEIIVGSPAAAAAAGAAAGPLSLSSATEAQLDALPGVGPVLAKRIIQFREQHGGFRSVDQLRQVPGFGERRLQDLRSQLRP
ncbi:competence protein ComEA [Streptacidiphilus sp. MAP12-20]|uniref:helix-hairpin-helix domain-containing protein n=1 Tax=Streptacidiphilus sp. MAP12-20 TaxID=3156299 RepID=UPI003511A258